MCVNAVVIHDRNQPRIMRLLSHHSILHDKPVPLGEQLRRFRQDGKLLQESGDSRFNGLK